MATSLQINYARERFNAWQQRQVLAHVARVGSWNGASRAGKPYRFVIFMNRLESYERAGLRFALHTLRVDLALTPITFEREAA